MARKTLWRVLRFANPQNLAHAQRDGVLQTAVSLGVRVLHHPDAVLVLLNAGDRLGLYAAVAGGGAARAGANVLERCASRFLSDRASAGKRYQRKQSSAKPAQMGQRTHGLSHRE